MEKLWQRKYGWIVGSLHTYRLKLKNEVIERCDGLPLTMDILAPVIEKQILGGG